MATKAKEVKQIKGIDVSHWQGNIDFNKVKKAGYDFVIIKAGGSDYGRYTDKKFKENYQKAVAAGLHVGAYYFNGPRCQGAASGVADAKHFLQILSDLKFDYPVFCDIEAVFKGFGYDIRVFRVHLPQIHRTGISSAAC